MLQRPLQCEEMKWKIWDFGQQSSIIPTEMDGTAIKLRIAEMGPDCRMVQREKYVLLIQDSTVGFIVGDMNSRLLSVIAIFFMVGDFCERKCFKCLCM